MPKKNPITILPKKNRIIFTAVIPTLRKIQEKKYFEECYKEKQKRNTIEYYVKDVERRTNNFFERNYLKRGQITKEGPLNIKHLTNKDQTEVAQFIREKLKKLDLTKAPSELRFQLDEIKIGVKNFLFKKKNDFGKQTNKKNVIKKLAEDIDFFDFLKPHHQLMITDLVNYNLALITRDKYLTNTQFEDLKIKVQKLIERKIDYSYAKKAKDISNITIEVLAFRPIKEELKRATVPERKEILKIITDLIEETYVSKAPHIIDAVIEKYGRYKCKR